MNLAVIFLLAFIGQVIGKPHKGELVGTWTSKSFAVFTGPGFYDPVSELLIEPDLPGISYSFTEDGHYEEALYRVTSNPQSPDCPTALISYQHGTYTLDTTNSSLYLTPIEVDGRQLVSEPCKSNLSSYNRYHQPTYFQKYQVTLDGYNGKQSLQIYQFDGSLMPPLYLAYRPPLMLPTETLNPTSAAETHSKRKRIKRNLENQYRTGAIHQNGGNHIWWWTAVAGIALGSCFLFLR